MACSVAETLAGIANVVGTANVLTEPHTTEPFATDWRGYYHGHTPAVVKPAGTQEVTAVVRLCAAAGIPIVPQGGNTGMSGGSVPIAGNEIIVNLARMNRILGLDALNNTIAVEAGCILANVQQAALGAGRLFPLSLGAEGSCQIGGNLSTNAGGINVLRYGNARDLVLGLEAVLPDGRIWDGMRSLRKDNTGYSLRHLFIGAEGTLGIITAAVLKLFPAPAARCTALVAVRNPADAIEFLASVRNRCGDRASACEMMPRFAFELLFRHLPGTRDPLPQPYPWYVLVEVSDVLDAQTVERTFEEILADCIGRGIAQDAIIARSAAQAAALWRMRESIPEAQKHEGFSIKHDVAVPVSRVPDLVQNAGAAIDRACPGARIIAYGHIGDGNLHYNVFPPRDADSPAADPGGTVYADINRIVYDIVADLGGSISAEHGIGQLKRDALRRYKNPVELELMRTLKHAFDPQNIMNPGKIL